MLTLIAFAAQAAAQPQSGTEQVIDRGGQIATRPAVDVGVKKTEIPPVLIRAANNPYATAGAANCAQIRSSLANLNAVLGPDFQAGATTKENEAGKLAEAGGKTLVNGLVPFRGLVREISGAAPAERRLNAAISAGHARRGFLRGLAVARKCRV
ncbi:hypothetical protein [Sphingomonas sp.]|uniref:hypothetical protein n=1 Tax=Sphingomonas sp. TaxID=28214 RepID=UPI000DB36ADA|nr:hypothetical protein [Sphingomonas sp.]PZU08739.1 MAG: hypothetical protein DI605_12460 [Sphingomonas sp.]